MTNLEEHGLVVSAFGAFDVAGALQGRILKKATMSQAFITHVADVSLHFSCLKI